ncbi:MAG: GTPase ObgE [Armatimonadetes bacterium]|nr:GTPase ObgE [Armatimonadota bacterium]
MAAGDFLDEIRVSFQSGKGGDGSASFHREKHVPRGGPNGADGGRGGDIVLIADRGKRTLYDFTRLDHYKAGDGGDAYLNKHGKDGGSIELHVPVGTLVYDDVTGDLVVDLSQDGMRFVLCRGGKGGMGNVHYTNSVRQAPTFAQKGGPSDLIEARLELKLLADVGLVGLPNAGKSTLLSALSAAKPKIAAYPFTTIAPNLGVVTVADHTFIMADLPGLIEGASEGIGLGHQFLRHAERNRVLLHVVDLFPFDETIPRENYQLIEDELLKYSEELFHLPRVIALNKTDLLPPDDVQFWVEEFQSTGHEVYAISAAAGQGLEPLKHALWRLVEASLATISSTVVSPVIQPKGEDSAWEVSVEDDEYVVTGKRLERMVAMTDLGNNEAVMYLHRRLQRMGVIDRLRDAGAEDGDTVRVGTFEFTYKD